MTVEECIQAYENLADRVFGHPRHLHIRKVSTPWRLLLLRSSFNMVESDLRKLDKPYYRCPDTMLLTPIFYLATLGTPGQIRPQASREGN